MEIIIKKNIGITGATGTLGKILCVKLKQYAFEFSCFSGDLRNQSDVYKWIYNNNFDAIIHLAAVVQVASVNEDPINAFNVNVGGTINLINSIIECKSVGKIWFFFASSSHVYKSSARPILEDYELLPISLYGKTKLMAEEIVREAGVFSKYNLEVCIGRIFSFYHPSQSGSFFYPSIRSRLESEDLSRPFELYGADSVRDFLNAEQVVDIIMRLFNKQTTGIFNVASGCGIKIRDFVQTMTKVKLDIAPKGIADSLVADISKIKMELGI
jgi:nucleoside-diphosphate-sugar epimerase